MPRRKREWYPGAIYHVMSRGNRKAQIFNEHEDYMRFLYQLRILKKKLPFTLHAICLMTNHIHLQIETDEISLSRIMQRQLSGYAEYFNEKYDLTGHLFQGRFTSHLIKEDIYFLEVSRYIHLNPVKAQMVNHPEDYLYSSYSVYMNYGNIYNPFYSEPGSLPKVMRELTETSRILNAFPENKSKHYQDFVEEKKLNPFHELHELRIQKAIKENDMWLPK